MGLNIFQLKLIKPADYLALMLEGVLTGVTLAASDEQEARRMAFLHATAAAENSLEIPNVIFSLPAQHDRELHEFYLQEIQTREEDYYAEAEKFLLPEDSSCQQIGISVERGPFIIDEHYFYFD